MSMSYALHFYKDNLKVRELRDLPNVAWAKQCGVSTGLHFYTSTSATCFRTGSRDFFFPDPFAIPLINLFKRVGGGHCQQMAMTVYNLMAEIL
jgi:hypothetical protein